MRLASATDKARTLIEALPYIRSYRNRVVIVKLGGEPLDDPELATRVVDDVALLALVGVKVIVVHGGGPQISRAMEAKGIVPRFLGGLRVTDDASMEVVEQILIGEINSGLVGKLNQAGVAAVGLSGIDAGCMLAEPVTGEADEDLGRVGRVTAVRPDYLAALLDGGFTPVLASVAPTADGVTLNVNADAVAAAVAGALDAEKLVYVTNVEGLYRDLGDKDSLVSEMKGDDLQAIVSSLSSGMRPKAEAALEALGDGVSKVHILDGRVEHALLLEIFTPEGIGTQVTP
ncbi:MAG TPA: acetylglutamate kinase [Actinomycetota bacterium]|nr:acetylglutamate kinase [Actinomycetota bacterium]